MTYLNTKIVNQIQTDNGQFLLDILKEVVLETTVKTDNGFKVVK